MNGRATMRALASDRAEYHEVASIHLHDGQVLRGEQRYLYQQTQEGLAVYFHSAGLSTQAGELFHNLRFVEEDRGILRASAQHQCEADLYRSEYAILHATDGGESFTIQHDVRGPHKNYRLHTRYQRLSEQQDGSSH